MKLCYKSDCSGIEAASVAWGPLGWEAVAFSEIEKFPSAVLAHHYPDVPNVGDFTRDDWTKYKGLDVIIAGTPCQDYSVAGKRAGAEGERGNLTIKYAEMLNESQIEFKVFLWENVPGVLSDRGNAFGRFLGLLAGEETPLVSPGGRWTDAGYVLGPLRSIAWRCLDAQYFGLALRRKRVFLAACPGNGLDPRQILFEFDGLRRDTPPGRGQEEDVAGTLGSRSDSGGWGHDIQSAAGGYMQVTQALTRSLGNGGPDDNRAQGGVYVPVTSRALLGDSPRIDLDTETFVANTLRGEGFDASEDGTGRANLIISFHGAQDPDVSGDITHPLGRNRGLEGCVASVAIRGRDGAGTVEMSGDLAGALRAPQGGGDKAHVLGRSGVRRLLPVECERLQGFQDGYTAISYHGRTAADGPRYKALGNSMAVSVIRWIGERIERAMLMAEGATE